MNKMYASALFTLIVVSSATVYAASPGEKLFQQKCKACHKVKGVGGTMGPDLTTTGSKRTPAFLAEKLDDPKKSTPSSTMPSFKSLSPKDKSALIDYMKTLK